jgi:hypothetical protein
MGETIGVPTTASQNPGVGRDVKESIFVLSLIAQTKSRRPEESSNRLRVAFGYQAMRHERFTVDFSGRPGQQ